MHPLTIVNYNKNLEVYYEQYHNFIGIDIGKYNFVVSIKGMKVTYEYDNSSEGISEPTI